MYSKYKLTWKKKQQKLFLKQLQLNSGLKMKKVWIVIQDVKTQNWGKHLNLHFSSSLTSSLKMCGHSDEVKPGDKQKKTRDLQKYKQSSGDI